MRRIFRVLILIVCLGMLTVTASAETAATEVNSIINVSADGRCMVSMTVKLHFSEPATSMTFPLPVNATGVSCNGASVRTYTSAVDPTVQLADLSGLNGVTGDYTLTFSYSLPDVLYTEQPTATTNAKLMMELPLLSGFDYPVKSMSFSVTMPGEITGKPTFSSAYMQTGVESRLTTFVGGQIINGAATQAFQDREKLSLIMEVSEEMFPGKMVILRTGNPEIVPMSVFGVLALVYWIIFMRTWPVFRRERTLPIEGLTAGDLGSRLTAAGVDLTMMVFSWAQLGYLRIMVDRKGRVILEKRMEMGNERSEFENRTFRALFAKADFVDATGAKYAKLCRSVAQTVSGIREMYTKRAGNVNIFRFLACGSSIFCGICFAMNMAENQIIRVMLCVIFGIFGAVSAWGIQGGMYKIHVRGKIPVYIGSACGILCILLGILAGQWLMGIIVVAGQYLVGLLAAYGGRRSDLGMENAGQILGLRHHLKKMDAQTLERLTENNPDYFFDMLPIAIALGVDTKFAKSFGNMPLPDCHYLLVAQDDKRTAAQWALLVRRIADRMDKRQRRLELEKWLPLNVRFY